MCTFNRFSVTARLLIGLTLAGSVPALAQGYKGFNVGRYEGQVSNGGGKSFGKGTLDIRNIDPTGAVQAHIRDSDGLEGEGLLTGAINANGVLQLNGTMTAPSNGAQWQTSLIAVMLPGGQLRMGNRQNTGNTVETETSVMTFAGTAPVSRTAPTPASAEDPNIRATYGSRSPRTCANTKAPASGPISAQQALQYFICGAEHVFGTELYLVGDVQLQIGKGRPIQVDSDRLSQADTDSPVYPIRGSFIQYQVHPLSKIYPNDGKNCTSYAQRNASGVCYRTTFGDWTCSMLDTSNNDSDRTIGIAPPQ